MSKPIVAIVGRPIVGKSTLFYALAGEKISIVEATPGVTRDRIYADVEWLGRHFTMVDTGGIEPESSDVILSQMREQAQIAIDTADVILLMTDVRQGLVDADSKVADMLRRSGKPVLLAVNKVDDKKFEMDVYEFYNLGMGEPLPIAAAGKLGMRRIRRFRMSPLLESRMWENLRLSTEFWGRIGSLYRILPEPPEMPCIHKLF